MRQWKPEPLWMWQASFITRHIIAGKHSSQSLDMSEIIRNISVNERQEDSTLTFQRQLVSDSDRQADRDGTPCTSHVGVDDSAAEMSHRRSSGCMWMCQKIRGDTRIDDRSAAAEMFQADSSVLLGEQSRINRNGMAASGGSFWGINLEKWGMKYDRAWVSTHLWLWRWAPESCLLQFDSWLHSNTDHFHQGQPLKTWRQDQILCPTLNSREQKRNEKSDIPANNTEKVQTSNLSRSMLIFFLKVKTLSGIAWFLLTLCWASIWS